MRFLKRVLICVLVYAAIYLPFIAILQAVSLADYTAAYTVGGITASVEMILCALIKREETKHERRSKSGDSDMGDTGRGGSGGGDCGRRDGY